jgi:hypothetical protein
MNAAAANQTAMPVRFMPYNSLSAHGGELPLTLPLILKAFLSHSDGG